MEQKKKTNKERIKDEEVILIKPYEVSESTLSTMKSSFIDNEADNLMKYMKFICVIRRECRQTLARVRIS